MRTRALRAGLLVAALVVATMVRADDLRDALNSAYASNPTLQAARAQQRALDETVPIARADALPSLGATAQHTEYVKQSGNSTFGPDRSFAGNLSLGVPIYSGGAIKNSIRAAKTRVGAGQADLRGIESSIFSQVVSAYMDVMLDEAVVGLNRRNVEVLDVNLQATSDRFEIGDLTRTDVAQSQARLAVAQGDTRIAEANLAGAREHYIRLVGKPPVDLDSPPPLPNLPESAEAAVAVALEHNPDIIAARERTRASEFDINVAGANRLPQLDVFSGAAYLDYYGTRGGTAGAVVAQSETTAQIGLRATIPIFQGGRPAALRRQAQARAGAAMETEIAVERDVVAQTRTAYLAWRAAEELTGSFQIAVDAATLSLEGVRAENTVGNRTILNILDAEQELLQSQVRLVTARRNAYVAGFTLLAAMGKAEAQDLGLGGGALYDPEVNYNRVRGKWNDWQNDPAPQPQSTRTVDTPVQTGETPSQ